MALPPLFDVPRGASGSDRWLAGDKPAHPLPSGWTIFIRSIAGSRPTVRASNEPVVSLKRIGDEGFPDPAKNSLFFQENSLFRARKFPVLQVSGNLTTTH